MSKSHQVELTSEHYPDVKRGGFAKVSPDDIGYFRDILDENRVITDPEEMDGTEVDI